MMKLFDGYNDGILDGFPVGTKGSNDSCVDRYLYRLNNGALDSFLVGILDGSEDSWRTKITEWLRLFLIAIMMEY